MTSERHWCTETVVWNRPAGEVRYPSIHDVCNVEDGQVLSPGRTPGITLESLQKFVYFTGNPSGLLQLFHDRIDK